MRFVVNSTKLLLLASTVSLVACGSGGDGDSGSLTGIPSESGGIIGGGGGNGDSGSLTGIPSESGGIIGGGGGNGTGDNIEQPVAPQLALGTSNGSMFQQGAMELGSNSVSFNGEVPVSVNIVNQAIDNELFTVGTVSVSFTSNCVEQGLATMTSPISTKTGTAKSVYKSIGCIGSDTITAFLNGTNSTATANIIGTSGEAGSIAFASAIPSTLAFRNFGSTGLPTVSEVQFQVMDKAGRPAAGKWVNFIPSTITGGITLTNDRAQTDANGIARAFLSAGSAKTTVRITAELEENPEVRTVSTTISIGTGAPSQNSMDISATILNPHAWDFSGNESEVVIRVSDYFKNPIADGTTISFFASGGQIDRECVYSAASGSCSVKWRGQEPRPGNARVTIMATLKGEEKTANDHNANGLFDGDYNAVREELYAATGLSAETYEPRPEAFLDVNFNGTRDPDEDYLDWNMNGQYDTNPASTFRGIRCTPYARNTSNHCTTEMADIFVQMEIVMSASIGLDDVRLERVSDGAIISAGSLIDPMNTYRIVVEDRNGHSAPNGTLIEVTIPEGQDKIAGGNINYTIPPTVMVPFSKEFAIIDELGSSLLKLKVTNVDGTEVDKIFTLAP